MDHLRSRHPPDDAVQPRGTPAHAHYGNQQNAIHIAAEDEQVILPYILGATGGYAGPFAQSPGSMPPPDAEVDRRGVEIAFAEVERHFAGRTVEVQPHSNPGFDILVGTRQRPVRYVEVKSTKGSLPRFFLSEFERTFSHAQALRFSLIVVTGIDVAAGTHGPIVWRDRGIDEARYDLANYQWIVGVRPD